MMFSRGFFVVCLFAALGLVGWFSGGILTVRPSPVPAAAAAGLHVWRAYGCETCHTLAGLGGAYAPDLSHIYRLRGPAYLREFLAHPAAFYPDARLMPRFALTRAEIEALLAFLADFAGDSGVAFDWFETMQVRGGSLGLPGQATPQAASAADPTAPGRVIFAQRCASCHSLERDVIQVGPSLWGIADRAWYRVPGLSPQQYIRASILAPGDYIVAGFGDVMQKNLGELLTSADIEAVIAFLMTLEEEG